MPALSGHAFILKTPTDSAKAVQDAQPTDGEFDGTAMGFEENEFNPAFDLIETTNKDTNENQTFLEGHGIFRGSITGSGFLQNNTLTDAIDADFFARRARWFQLTQTDNPSWKATGKFMIGEWPKTGAHDDALKHNISLSSNGAVTVVR